MMMMSQLTYGYFDLSSGSMARRLRAQGPWHNLLSMVIIRLHT